MLCRTLIAVAAAFMVVLAARPGFAHDDDRYAGREDFIGLWRAIDTSDGTLQTLSIDCPGRKTCNVRLNDTGFHLSCDPAATGIALGQGTIRGNVLEVDLTLTCTGASESIGTQPNKFILDRKQGMLTDMNDDEIPEQLVFHKVSD